MLTFKQQRMIQCSFVQLFLVLNDNQFKRVSQLEIKPSCGQYNQGYPNLEYITSCNVSQQFAQLRMYTGNLVIYINECQQNTVRPVNSNSDKGFYKCEMTFVTPFWAKNSISPELMSSGLKTVPQMNGLQVCKISRVY